MLSFKTMAVLMLMKGGKSLQLSLNSLLPKLKRSQVTVDKSAYSKARRKFKHTAFIELNERAVVDVMYADGDYETWKGHRILAVDGSKVMLPDNDETIKEFGTLSYHTPYGVGEHCYAVASVLYDALNRVAVNALLAAAHSYEGDLAVKHLKHTKANDLVIYDRGYCSYRMITQTTSSGSDFLIRCPSGRFRVAADMLHGKGPDDVITTLSAPSKFLADPENKALLTTQTVRFVRVTLDNGEYEVLVTSLLDQQAYKTADFLELYWMRWGIETFYGILKTRLILENFSGYSPEAVRQDFFATIFLTGIETLMTMDTEASLARQRGGHPKKVNKAVSFSTIKEHAFALFYSKAPQEKVLAELTTLFTSSPTLIRKDRTVPRKNTTSQQILGFWKRTRKTVF
jgi:Transposase DDE domain